MIPVVESRDMSNETVLTSLFLFKFLRKNLRFAATELVRP